MELKLNNLPNITNIEKPEIRFISKDLNIEKENLEININSKDLYNSSNINKGNAMPEYSLSLSKNPDEIKENLSKISESIKSNLNTLFNTDSIKDIQNIIGSEETGKLDNNTINNLSSFINADNFVKGHIENIIKYREFEANINLFKIQMQLLDKALETIK